MIAFILFLYHRKRPERDEWQKIICISLFFEIPYQIFNILGITVFNLWQNNANSPFPTLFGSPLETIPFAFLGAVLSLLLFRFAKNWKEKGILWVFIGLLCALQAYLSTLLGFLTWLNWNFLASFLFWLGLIGILIGLDYIPKMGNKLKLNGAKIE
ncbi:MAG TPA: hypothetical protein VMV49_12955 [Candidatus Deferrimicrobium sp.]|nr:hypothetical protein [Candidatus Deferrimicrobium sp.]